MSKVTRITASSNINRKKYDALVEQAKLLGHVRKEVWQRFGSINGVGIDHLAVRKTWVRERDFSPLPAKAWKETLRDAMHNIYLYEEAAKKEVKRAIFKRFQDAAQQKTLFTLLKGNGWVNDKFLCRMMRKYKKHGRSKADNQIVVEDGVYKQHVDEKGRRWLRIPSLVRRNLIAIPLDSKVHLKGCLRLIMQNGVVHIHRTIEQKRFRPCGDSIIGVDKGYSEAFADSKGNFYGQSFGPLLTDSSDALNKKMKARNKLLHLLKKKPHKARNIRKFNLGKKKFTSTLQLKKEQLRGIAFQAAHKIVDIAKEVRAEDLTKPIRTERGRTFNRRMSSWAKSVLAESLESVTKARSSRLRLVNSAYTSQMDSHTRKLEGMRVGDKFHHANGDVSHADTNAAVNIEQRGDDTEITRYLSHLTVKKILLDRLAATGGVSRATSSATAPPGLELHPLMQVSTESELLENFRLD